jgi:glucose-1-phosphate thymidylyltransferase
VEDPQRFGIAEVDHMKQLIDIEEKPENPKSNLAIIGAYVYSHVVWLAIDNIERSERGELEISDANKVIMRRSRVTTCEISGWWSDAGTQLSYRSANEKMWSNMDEPLAFRLDIMSQLSIDGEK